MIIKEREQLKLWLLGLWINLKQLFKSVLAVKQNLHNNPLHQNHQKKKKKKENKDKGKEKIDKRKEKKEIEKDKIKNLMMSFEIN